MTSLLGCQTQDTVDKTAEFTAFTKTVFHAVKAQDFEAFYSLCVQIEDVRLDGDFLIEPRYRDSYDWRKLRRENFDKMLKRIETRGGIDSLQWIGFDKAIGINMVDSEFVGNMYIRIQIAGVDHIIEIGVSRMSKNRGRVITDLAPLQLMDTSYHYEW